MLSYGHLDNFLNKAVIVLDDLINFFFFMSVLSLERQTWESEKKMFVQFKDFLVAKLLYKSKCPSVCLTVCLSVRFRGKRDFLGP